MDVCGCMKKIQINPQIIYIKSKTSTDYNYKKVKGLWSFELNKTDLDMLVNYSTLYFTDDTIYGFMASYLYSIRKANDSLYNSTYIYSVHTIKMILDGKKINIKIDFSKYSIITGGYHRDANNHWILWLVKYSTDSKTGSIYCMDSLNSVTYKELTTFVDNWKAFVFDKDMY